MSKLSISLQDDIHYTLIYCAKTRNKTVSRVVAKALILYFEKMGLPILPRTPLPQCFCSQQRVPGSVGAAGVSHTSVIQRPETSSDMQASAPISQAFAPRSASYFTATSTQKEATLRALIERLDQIEEKLHVLQLSAIGDRSKENGLDELAEGYYKAQQEVVNIFSDSFQPKAAVTSKEKEGTP